MRNNIMFAGNPSAPSPLEDIGTKREVFMTNIRQQQRKDIVNTKRSQPSIFPVQNDEESDPFQHLFGHPNRDVLVDNIKRFYDLEVSIDEINDVKNLLASSDM